MVVGVNNARINRKIQVIPVFDRKSAVDIGTY